MHCLYYNVELSCFKLVPKRLEIQKSHYPKHCYAGHFKTTKGGTIPIKEERASLHKAY